jgi:hypothetical protein
MRIFSLLFFVWLVAGVARAENSASPAEEAYRGVDAVLLEQVRGRFKAATESADVTRQLIELLDGKLLPTVPSEWPAIFQAYRASLEGLVGKHSLVPWEKYTRVKAGIGRFRGLAEAHPGSIEVRALRFAFYGQLPELFGVRHLADQDLAALVDLFARGNDSTVSKAYCRDVIRWILENGRPSPDQKRRLTDALEKLAPDLTAAGGFETLNH